MNTVSTLYRELSLIEFNKRVLAQAQNKSVPLMERLKFLCIVSSNIDELFEVRVAYLKHQQQIQPEQYHYVSVLLPKLLAIARELISRQYAILNEELIPALDSVVNSCSAKEQCNELVSPL